MKQIGDYLSDRADQLDLGRASQLSEIQAILNQDYPGQVRAKRLKSGVLTLTTPSAAVANDLRLRQVELVEKFEQFHATVIKIVIA